MEKTQDLENSMSLTTNTHSGIRSVGPSTPGVIFTQIRMQTNICIRAHTLAHAMYAELTRTPAKALALTVGPLYPMMSYVLKLTVCTFAVQIHPHASPATRLQTRTMKAPLFRNCRKKIEQWLFVFLTFLSPTRAFQ